MKFTGLHPTHIRDFEWPRLTVEHGAVEEMQPDRSGRVGVLSREIFVFDPDLDAKLFANFALECGLQRFVRFHLAAGELPVARQMNVIETSGDENLVCAANDGGDDGYDHERPAAA